MIASGEEIRRLVDKGDVVIRPFRPERVNPNSYNLALGPTLLVYARPNRLVRWAKALAGRPWCLDTREQRPTRRVEIPFGGYVLKPGVLYLGCTEEWTETRGYVPKLDGRSSIGRLGMSIHVTAAYGDNGFRGRFTLELTVVHPVRVYAGDQVAQISYSPVIGRQTFYQGKYQDSGGVVPSRMYLDGTTGVVR